jgi:hypothetical protein
MLNLNELLNVLRGIHSADQERTDQHSDGPSPRRVAQRIRKKLANKARSGEVSANSNHHGSSRIFYRLPRPKIVGEDACRSFVEDEPLCESCRKGKGHTVRDSFPTMHPILPRHRREYFYIIWRLSAFRLCAFGQRCNQMAHCRFLHVSVSKEAPAFEAKMWAALEENQSRSHATLALLDMPWEVKQHIMKYVDGAGALDTIRQVCRELRRDADLYRLSPTGLLSSLLTLPTATDITSRRGCVPLASIPILQGECPIYPHFTDVEFHDVRQGTTQDLIRRSFMKSHLFNQVPPSRFDNLVPSLDHAANHMEIIRKKIKKRLLAAQSLQRARSNKKRNQSRINLLEKHFIECDDEVRKLYQQGAEIVLNAHLMITAMGLLEA